MASWAYFVRSQVLRKEVSDGWEAWGAALEVLLVCLVEEGFGGGEGIFGGGAERDRMGGIGRLLCFDLWG